MNKVLENLIEAERLIKTSDHLIYMSFPVIKDKKILTRAIINIYEATQKIISSILQREYLLEKINLTDNHNLNFKIFVEKCAPFYNINQEEIKSIQELFEIIKEHKKSPMEFFKNEQLVILSNNLETLTISLEKAKKFLNTTKLLLKKTKNNIIKD